MERSVAEIGSPETAGQPRIRLTASEDGLFLHLHAADGVQVAGIELLALSEERPTLAKVVQAIYGELWPVETGSE